MADETAPKTDEQSDQSELLTGEGEDSSSEKGSQEKSLVLPDGSPVDPREAEVLTERGLERSAEEERFVSVIIKRNDQSKRHPDDVLQAAIREGKEQIDRRPVSLILSAMAAGLILGFTAMAVALAHVMTADAPGLTRIAVALVYPLGFVLCIMSGAELFTEHTATAVYPVLDRRASVVRLLRLWGLVLLGNLLGALASAALLYLAEGVVGAAPGYVEVGRHLVDPPAGQLLASALLAGWLMALGGWLIIATPPTYSQIACIYIVTFLIGLGGLHHSIAGAVEMFAALLHGDEYSLVQAVRFISLAALGNLIGGSFFVAVLNYGHIRQSQSIGK